MMFPYVFIFILGAIIGSFLNVVILRYNTGRTIMGRSGCLSCGQTLRPQDMIPVVSWLLLRGRCQNCKSKISIQYPLVELVTGALFVFLFWSVMPLIEYPYLMALSFVWNAIIVSILVVICVYDIRHKIIPDALSYTFAGLAFIQTLLFFPVSGPFNTLSFLDLGAGIIFFLPFFLLWFISRGRWIGLGDGKLALGIGWYLGFIHGLSAIILAFWIGALVAIVFVLIERLKLHSKTITMKTEIPFAPFLIVGVLIEFFLRIDVIGVGLFF